MVCNIGFYHWQIKNYRQALSSHGVLSSPVFEVHGVYFRCLLKIEGTNKQQAHTLSHWKQGKVKNKHDVFYMHDGRSTIPLKIAVHVPNSYVSKCALNACRVIVRKQNSERDYRLKETTLKEGEMCGRIIDGLYECVDCHGNFVCKLLFLLKHIV